MDSAMTQSDARDIRNTPKGAKVGGANFPAVPVAIAHVANSSTRRFSRLGSPAHHRRGEAMRVAHFGRMLLVAVAVGTPALGSDLQTVLKNAQQSLDQEKFT